MKNFEKELPQGYEEVYHFDARAKKEGIILNTVASVVIAAFIAIAFLTVKALEFTYSDLIIGGISFIVIMLAYIVLHELVHGAVYKLMTKEKLTFGISWSCAFCGVPNVYVYRKTAIIALVMPFLVFSVIFVTLAAVLHSVSNVFYMVFITLEGFNFGGASGDLCWLLMFLFKYRDKTTLMRDTGPEQFIYIKKD